MPSLDERLGLLLSDLRKGSPAINAYDDLPFALFQYDPEQEDERELAVRKKVERLRARLEREGKPVAVRSLAPFLWEAIESARGKDALFQHEEMTSFSTAEEAVSGWLADKNRFPLGSKVAEMLNSLKPAPHVAFLYRAGAFAPALAAVSSLLRSMHGKTRVPTVLFYPGKREGEWNLRFMGLSQQRDLPSSYHVRIY